MEFTIPELKLLHAAGVPMQYDDYTRGWMTVRADNVIANPGRWRPDPAALVFRSPEGVLTLGHSREDLLAAQAAGLLLEQFVEGTGWVRWNSRNKWCVSDRSAPYRLAPGQPAWPAPEAKPELPRFAVGQVWERRDGERFVVSKILNGLVWSAENGHVNVYEASGKASSNGPSVADLIRLISEPEAADPWPREKRALAAGLRVQCRCAAVLDMPWHTIGDSTKHLLQGDDGGSWADPNYTFRIHPDDEAEMQAIERNYPMPPEPPAQPINTAANTDYEAWLAARPARLAARKPLAVVRPTKRWREDLDAMQAAEGETNFFHDGTGVYAGAWPIHNPDARMATVPVGHEKGMP